MANETKELQVQDTEKQEVTSMSDAERTRARKAYIPRADIYETNDEIIVVADMPGVDSDGITIDLKDNVLSISGEVKPFESGNESDVLIEFEIGRYHRQFNLSEVIDQSKIEAKHEDGVLRLTLPKAEKAIPRQIAVTAG